VKRVRSTIWVAIIVVSTIFLLLTAVLWPASYWRVISFEVQDMGGDLRHNDRKQADIFFSRGSISVSWRPQVEAVTKKEVAERKQQGPEIDLRFYFEWVTNADRQEAELEHERLGFGYEFSDISPAARDEPSEVLFWPLVAMNRVWKIPAWFVFLLELIAPAIWLGLRYRNRRSASKSPRRASTKRLAPLLGRTLALVSIVLFVLTAMLWPISHWRCSKAQFYCGSGDLRHDADSNLYLHCEHGSLWVKWLRTVYPAILEQNPIGTRELVPRDQYPARRLTAEFHWFRTDRWPRSTEMDHGKFGFGYSFRRDITNNPDRPTNGGFFGGRPYLSETDLECVAPLWLVLILQSIAPALWLRSHWRKRRYAHGLCAVCGYDLRGTPSRCPECGQVTAENPRAGLILWSTGGEITNVPNARDDRPVNYRRN